MPVLCRNLQ